MSDQETGGPIVNQRPGVLETLARSRALRIQTQQRIEQAVTRVRTSEDRLKRLDTAEAD